MTTDKALDLALEALEAWLPTWPNLIEKQKTAITAIKQARALDKKAENARELGLDYEPVCHICNGTGEMDSGGTHPWGWAINIPCECTTPPTAQRQWVGLDDDDISALGLSIAKAKALESLLKRRNT